MKKVLSVFLALVMMLSLATVSFAADNAITVGVKKTVTVSATGGDVFALKFKAPAKDVYNISFKLLNDSEVMCDLYYVLDEEGFTYVDGCALWYDSELDFDWNPGESDFNFGAEKNSNFEIDFSLPTDDEGNVPANAKVEVTITRCNASTLKLGTTKIAATGNMFTYTPDKDGVYNFVSTAKSGVDPYIILADIEGVYYDSDDNGREDDFNFDLSVYLYKGVTYYIEVSEYERDFAPAAYNMTVSYNKKQVAESIELYSQTGANSLRIYKGDWDYADMYVVPTGAIYNSGIEAYTENEKVASCEYYEGDGYITVYGNKVGTTKLVVTTPDGTSAELKVKVVPAFFFFFDNLFYTISEFFSSLFFGWLLR